MIEAIQHSLSPLETWNGEQALAIRRVILLRNLGSIDMTFSVCFHADRRTERFGAILTDNVTTYRSQSRYINNMSMHGCTTLHSDSTWYHWVGTVWYIFIYSTHACVHCTVCHISYPLHLPLYLLRIPSQLTRPPFQFSPALVLNRYRARAHICTSTSMWSDYILFGACMQEAIWANGEGTGTPDCFASIMDVLDVTPQQWASVASLSLPREVIIRWYIICYVTKVVFYEY